jgi:hypothetical protein
MLEKVKFDIEDKNISNTKGDPERILNKKLKRVKCNVSDFFYSSKQSSRMQNNTFDKFGLK